jgi:hypothetical protein
MQKLGEMIIYPDLTTSNTDKKHRYYITKPVKSENFQ